MIVIADRGRRDNTKTGNLFFIRLEQRHLVPYQIAQPHQVNLLPAKSVDGSLQIRDGLFLKTLELLEILNLRIRDGDVDKIADRFLSFIQGEIVVATPFLRVEPAIELIVPAIRAGDLIIARRRDIDKPAFLRVGIQLVTSERVRLREIVTIGHDHVRNGLSIRIHDFALNQARRRLAGR